MKQHLFIAIVLIFLYSCSKNKDTKLASSQATVYVAGDTLANDGYTKPVLWKNGIPVILTTNNYSEGSANSVYVSGSDVYVAGRINNSNTSVPVVWKNGVISILSNTQNGVANEVFVYGSNTYVVGTIYTSVNGYVATDRAAIWKNSSLTYLGNPAFKSEANSIFVTTSTLYPGTEDVYVAGGVWEAYGFSAKLWKNNTAILEVGGNTRFKSIFVTGNSDIYLSGGEFGGPWRGFILKNGTYSYIGNYFVEKMIISGSNTYTIGGISPSTLIKNGNTLTMSNIGGGASFRSMYVFGSDIYVVGNSLGASNSVPTIWKNGVAKGLTNDHTGDAKSIYVVQ